MGLAPAQRAARTLLWINARSETSTGYFPSPPLRIRSNQQFVKERKQLTTNARRITDLIGIKQNVGPYQNIINLFSDGFRAAAIGFVSSQCFLGRLGPLGGLASQITNLIQKLGKRTNSNSSLLEHDAFPPPTKIHFFPTIDCPAVVNFYHFFSMKMAELGKIVLVSCIIDFDDIQLCLRHFS